MTLGVGAAFTAAWLASGLGSPVPAPAAEPSGRPLSAMPVIRWAVHLPGLVPNVATPTEPGGPAVSMQEIFVGYSGQSGLLVLDRADGRVRSVLAARAPVGTTPILVGEDRVLFSDRAGYTSAYSRRDGAWRRDWEHYSGAPVVSTPTLADGVLYVTNVDELVFALDATTGELRWRYEHKLDMARAASLELFGAPAPTLSSDTAFVGFSDGFLVALDRATGSERWKTQVGEGTYPDLIAPAVLVGDGAVMVAGYTKPLVHLGLETRAPSWRIDVGSAAAPTLTGDTCYHPGSDGKLRRIDTRTGTLAWTWDSATSGPLLGPQVTPLGILVGSTDSTLFLVDPESGTQLWTLDPEPLLTGFGVAPALVGDEIYALSNGGVLYALAGRSGTPPPAPADWVTPRP
ncbi:MAG: hypothetical protein EXR71_05280 [Myxococcales bacterium]|nr:hypothetical protein [Myxococcales bacterium]